MKTGPDGLCVKCGADLKNWRETLGEHDCLPEPALVRCDTADEMDCRSCHHEGEHLWLDRPFSGSPCGRRYCKSSDSLVRCNPVPEPAAAHGVAFKGNAPQLLRYLSGLTEERFQAMMHAGFTITDADEQRKAEAERIFRDMTGDREAEAGLEEKVLAVIHDFGAITRGNNNPALIQLQEGCATARIMELIGEGE